MDWCLLVEGEYKLYHSVWEPPIMCVAWRYHHLLVVMLTMKVCRPKYYLSLCQNRALAPLQIPTSLCEGPIYLLLCWVITLLLKSTSWRAQLSFASITINLYLGMTMTGSLLPWITMSSQSLIIKGALQLCFAVSERASEIPSCYIILWSFWESVVIRDLLLLLASWLCHWYE